jgi:hypothetical protein
MAGSEPEPLPRADSVERRLAELQAAERELELRRIELNTRAEHLDARDANLDGLKIFGISIALAIASLLVVGFLLTLAAAMSVEGSERIGLIQAALGGAAAVALAVFGGWRAWGLTRELDQAEIRIQHEREQIEEQRRRTDADIDARRVERLDERYQKAIELLGHPELATRIGGLLALERLLVDPRFGGDHWTVVQVL